MRNENINKKAHELLRKFFIAVRCFGPVMIGTFKVRNFRAYGKELFRATGFSLTFAP